MLISNGFNIVIFTWVNNKCSINGSFLIFSTVDIDKYSPTHTKALLGAFIFFKKWEGVLKEKSLRNTARYFIYLFYLLFFYLLIIVYLSNFFVIFFQPFWNKLFLSIWFVGLFDYFCTFILLMAACYYCLSCRPIDHSLMGSNSPASYLW